MTPRNLSRAAIYARYSTEKQSEASVDDQFRVCERIAEREGFEIVARFSDAAISGGTANRPAYQDMLEAARRHEFEAIIAEDSSRLWRELSEQWRTLKELSDLRIAVVGHGLDTRREESKILLSVSGAMAEAYRDEIARRTHRGLEGRARAQRPTGGRAYGYAAATGSRSGEIEIIPVQAETVRRIFREYAEGHSPRQIAAGLNVDGIPSPGATWLRTEGGKRRDGKWQASAIHGELTKGTGILNNERYIGRIVWGRTRWRRGASDSSRRTVTQLDEPLHAYTDERLRIVPQPLWDAVRKRQSAVISASGAIRGALQRKDGRPALHILSGLLSCGKCGGSYIVVNSRDYGCNTHKQGGPAACSNAVRLTRKGIEAELLRVVRDELLSPEAVQLAVDTVRAELKQQKASTPKAPTSAALAAKDREIEQLRAMLKSGTLSPVVAQAAIAAAESERGTMTAAQQGKSDKSAAKVIEMLPRVADQFRLMVDQLPGIDMLPAERIEARALIAEMIGGKPKVMPKGDRVFLQLGADIRPLLRAAGANVANVVAGAGFEPATFGL
jgi:site-specific DNA recombinase